jgi:hypothetical protein
MGRMDPQLASLVAQQLGRPLDPEEEFVLMNVTAQGTAKINRDQLHGAPLEATLLDLKIAYRGMKARKRALEAHPLPTAAREILAKLQRNPSLRELEMLQENKWFRVIRTREQQGEALQDILEDIANADTDEKVRQEAVWTCANMGCRVQLQSLCPTQRPVSQSLAETTLKSAENNLFAVGVSPVLSWFREPPVGVEPESLSVLPSIAFDGLRVDTVMSLPHMADSVLQDPTLECLEMPDGGLLGLHCPMAPTALLSERPRPPPLTPIPRPPTPDPKHDVSPQWDSVLRTGLEPRPSKRQIRWALPMVVSFAPSAPTTPRPPRSPRKPRTLRRLFAFCC